MSSAVWLLLYLAPLLALTAAVFAWLGWQWRSSDMQKPAAELETAGAVVQETPPITLSESSVPHEQAENELRALRDDLKSAQAKIRLSEDDAAKAHEAAKALETETNRLLHDVETIRAERDKVVTELTAARAELELFRAQPMAKETASVSTKIESTVPPAEKPKRKRTTVTKPKKAAPNPSLREKITALETQLTAQQSTASPAEVKRLQNQIHVLQRVEQQSSTLTLTADDDLTQIKGIKKVFSEQLRAHGIRTWKQIAQWNDDELRAFSELLAFKNRASREKWQEQARALHEAAHGPFS